MKGLHSAVTIILILAGLNYGLILLDWWNLTEFFGGEGSQWANVFYALAGLSALYEIAHHKKTCKECKMK